MKEAVSQKLFWGLGIVGVVALAGLLFYFFKASDPAAQGPIPYKKLDYGAHMEEQKRDLNRQTPSDPASAR